MGFDFFCAGAPFLACALPMPCEKKALLMQTRTVEAGKRLKLYSN
jgi:hypothetical protein